MKPRRNGLTYDAMWRAALRAQPDLVTITSYNEWSEGTQIEPAKAQPAESAYRSYDGAYGLHGRIAARAYVARTACWTLVLAGRLYPLTTPSGTSFATRRASAARSTSSRPTGPS